MQLVRDVGNENGYGAINAARLARDNPADAARNIENLVYYCIAMYFNTFDWSTLISRANGFSNPTLNGGQN